MTTAMKSTGHYTESPVYKLVASHCSCCGRPLADGTSIEAGIGPICRGKYGYEDAYDIDDGTAQETVEILKGLGDSKTADRIMSDVLDNDSRAAVNKLNHAVAVWAKDETGSLEDIATCIDAMRAMGYDALADRIGGRLASVTIEIKDGRILLNTPYSPEFVDAIKSVRRRRWDADNKVWSVPVSMKKLVWGILQKVYKGELGSGPQGMFRI